MNDFVSNLLGTLSAAGLIWLIAYPFRTREKKEDEQDHKIEDSEKKAGSVKQELTEIKHQLELLRKDIAPLSRLPKDVRSAHDKIRDIRAALKHRFDIELGNE